MTVRAVVFDFFFDADRLHGRTAAPDPFIPEFTIDDLHWLPGLLGLSPQIRP